jgi:kumamolisin
VGILRIGGHFEKPDIKKYFDALHRPTPTITQVGTSQSEDLNALIETSVDIEVIGRFAPGAKLVVYFSPGVEKRAYLRLLHKAVTDANNPAVLSISWGIPEQLWDAGQPAEIDLTLQLAHTTGITVCAATGDYGSSAIAGTQGGPDGLAHVVLPASSPWALACGGTVLDQDAGGVTEVVWNDQYGATGGGVSAVFPAQMWQQQMNVPQCANPGGGTGRGVPDVAAHAGLTHYFTDAPGWRSPHIGGTSVSAPIWAALVALIDEAAGKNMGYLNAYMCAQYAAGPGLAAFRDITSGNNTQKLKKGTAFVTPPSYAAGARWDACTGLGSPSGENLLELLLQRP